MDKKLLLIEYMRCTDIDKKMLWKGSAEHQMSFVNRMTRGLLKVPCFVISRHRSKSVELPVYGFRMRNGIEIIMRDNFYDWKVSIKTPMEMFLDLDGCRDLFSGWSHEVGVSEKTGRKLYSYDGDIAECYCEGFNHDWVHPFYRKGCRECTIEVGGDYRLYTLLYLLNSIPNPREENGYSLNLGESVYQQFQENLMKAHPSCRQYELFPHLGVLADDFEIVTDEEDRHYDTPYWKLCAKYPEIREEFARMYMLYHFPEMDKPDYHGVQVKDE